MRPDFTLSKKKMATLSGLWKLTKLGVVGGAVYFTVVNGVWSSESTQVKNFIDQFRVPVATDTQQFQEDIGRPWGEIWNSGVQTVFKTVADSPDLAKTYTKKAISSTKDLIQQKS